MNKSVFVLCFLLGIVASQYVQSQYFNAPQAGGYGSASSNRKDLVPAGYKISSLWIYPTYEATTDFVVAGLGFCATAVSNGVYNTSATVCADQPCMLSGSWLQYFCPTRHSINLAVDEYVTSSYMYFNDADIAICHLEFRTNKGQTVAAGSYFSYAPQRPVTWTVPAGGELAGFYTENYIAIERMAFFTRNAGVCGDGIVQTGEQCDKPGSPCCTSDCKFAPATTTCRAVAGLCDVAETCTGSSDSCPADQFRSAATPCGEFFGMCDVELQMSCSGNSAQCFPTPSLPATTTQLQDWTGFNVLSFNGYTCSGGDVEGRLAARNYALLDGFTLGLKIADQQPFSLYCGGNVSWSSGSMHPDTARGLSDSFTGPDYLGSLFVDAPDAAAVGTAFDNAQAYYTRVQSELAALGTNAQATLQYGDGLLITCNKATDQVYHLTVDAATFNAVNWYSTSGCRFASRWVIDITGTGSVSFQGEPFPGIVERVIYNVLGSGRMISANNGVAGHILAPQNTYTQSQGVTYGKVIVGHVAEARQNNNPNCTNFASVTISLRMLKPVTLGDKVIYVADISDVIAGDRVCIEGNCQVVSSGSYVLVDGQIAGALQVASAFQVTSAAKFAQMTVEDPDSVTRNVPLAVRPSEITSPSTDFDWSSGSVVSASFVLVAILALFN